MLNIVGQQPKPDLEVVARIKDWARERCGLTDDMTVMVSELRCQEEDCPDLETVIALLAEPGRARKHKVLEPIAELTRGDVMSLAARGTPG